MYSRTGQKVREVKSTRIQEVEGKSVSPILGDKSLLVETLQEVNLARANLPTRKEIRSSQPSAAQGNQSMCSQATEGKRISLHGANFTYITAEAPTCRVKSSL